MPRCLLALGANLGNREEALQNALCKIASLPQTCLLARSPWKETPAVGGPAGQQDFLNGAVLIDTMLAAETLADRLQAIEAQQGRERKVRWAARTLDIDLLLYGKTIIDTPGLTIPHPRMTFRRFVLAPAAEIAGQMIVPASGWTISALLKHLRTAARYVAITSSDTRVADGLAHKLCQRLNVPRLEEFFAKSQAEGDSCCLLAVEWAQHDELRKRLPSLKNNVGEKVAPVISGWGVEGPKKPADFIQPALTIVAGPSEGGTPVEVSEFRGPLVRLDADDLECGLAEALAAICAAWPV